MNLYDDKVVYYEEYLINATYIVEIHVVMNMDYRHNGKQLCREQKNLIFRYKVEFVYEAYNIITEGKLSAMMSFVG